MRGRVLWNTVSSDGRLLVLTVGLRSLAYGGSSVILALYLAADGFSTGLIGAFFTAALAGGALSTVLCTTNADRLGRRRILLIAAALMAVSGAVLALTSNLVLLGLTALAGTISPSGKDVGPLLSIEQAALPQTTDAVRRTGLFAVYNLVSSLAVAIGALLAGLPARFGLPALAGYRTLFWGYSAAGLALLLLYSRLSPAVEPARAEGKRGRLGVHRSREIVLKLSALFALDAFAGGLVVQGLLAYWFHLRYGASVELLGAIFFGANLCSALSFLAAAPLARRIGLLETMVFTHIPSNVLLILVPIMPSFGLAVAMLLARQLLSQLDVPTRQSYTMAVVEPDERSAAAGLTSVARNAAAAIAPIFTGATLAVPALGLPFLFAGVLKIGYDLTIFALFRQVRPPEERR